MGCSTSSFVLTSPGTPQPSTRNPKPETRNPKPEIRNPKPETQNCTYRNPYTLNRSTIQQSVHFISRLTPHTSHPHTSHLTPHTPHLTPHTSHLTRHPSNPHPQTESLIDNLLVRMHSIIERILQDRPAPWQFEIPFSGSLISTFPEPPPPTFQPRTKMQTVVRVPAATKTSTLNPRP